METEDCQRNTRGKGHIMMYCIYNAGLYMSTKSTGTFFINTSLSICSSRITFLANLCATWFSAALGSNLTCWKSRASMDCLQCLMSSSCENLQQIIIRKSQPLPCNIPYSMLYRIASTYLHIANVYELEGQHR
jgi:hypothetical protein